jgi:DNA-binding MarR family transcriptional regulator
VKSPRALTATQHTRRASGRRTEENISQRDTIAIAPGVTTGAPQSVHARRRGAGATRARRFTKSEYEALAAFRARLRRFLRFSEDGARAAGLTAQQHQLLLAIMGMPGRDWTTVAELADALQIRHHAAVGLIDRCARARLVTRSRNPEDRRQVRVSLTKRGAAVLARLSERNRRELSALRQALSLTFLDGV